MTDSVHSFSDGYDMPPTPFWMAFQATQALESTESTLKAKAVVLPSNLYKGTIKIPHSIVEF